MDGWDACLETEPVLGYLSCVTTSWSSVGLSSPPTITLHRHLLLLIFFHGPLFFFFFWYFFFALFSAFFFSGSLNEKFHTARHATDGTTFCFALVVPTRFSFDFIIPKVTALGARTTTTTTTFYLMSWFWHSQEKQKEATIARKNSHVIFAFRAIIQVFFVRTFDSRTGYNFLVGKEMKRIFLKNVCRKV